MQVTPMSERSPLRSLMRAPWRAALLLPVALTAQGRGNQAAQTPATSAMETLGKIGIIVKDGMLQPVTEFSDNTTWIRERVFVESNFDSDHDGKLDRIHADIVRPGAAEKAGFKLSVIMKASPYIGPT